MKRDLRTLMLENKKLLPGVVIIGVLAVLLILRAGYNYHKGMHEEISSYEELLRNSSVILARGESLEERLNAAVKMSGTLEKGLLGAEQPSIGAAELQEEFKKYSSKRKIDITSETALSFEEAGDYIKIPVEFRFKVELWRLSDLLYDIQASPLLMGVKKLRIKSPEDREPTMLTVTLVVEGAIRNSGEE